MRPAAPRGSCPCAIVWNETLQRSVTAPLIGPDSEHACYPSCYHPVPAMGQQEGISRKQKALENQGLSAFANGQLAERVGLSA